MRGIEEVGWVFEEDPRDLAHEVWRASAGVESVWHTRRDWWCACVRAGKQYVVFHTDQYTGY